MGEDRSDRRKLGPQLIGLEHLDVLAVDRYIGVLELAELLDLPDDERETITLIKQKLIMAGMARGAAGCPRRGRSGRGSS